MFSHEFTVSYATDPSLILKRDIPGCWFSLTLDVFRDEASTSLCLSIWFYCFLFVCLFSFFFFRSLSLFFFFLLVVCNALNFVCPLLPLSLWKIVQFCVLEVELLRPLSMVISQHGSAAALCSVLTPDNLALF